MEHSVKTVYRWLFGAGIIFVLYGMAVMILSHSNGFSLVNPKNFNGPLFSALAWGIVIAVGIVARPWLKTETRRGPLTSILQTLIIAILMAGCFTAATWIAAGSPNVQLHSR